MTRAHSQTRRTFLQAGAAVAATALVRPRIAFSAEENAPAVVAPLSQFGYGDVELLDGPSRGEFHANHVFYSGLNEEG